MKNLIFPAFALFLISCNNGETKTVEVSKTVDTTETMAPPTKLDLPYKFSYEGTAVMGNPENVKIVMDFNHDFASGNTDNIGSYFADSVHVVFADGSGSATIRDSAAAMVKGWRNTMSDIQLSYISAMAVNNQTTGDEWVFQWIDEADNYKDGKKVHHALHEDYRLVNGKIREMIQYAQAIPVKK
ncbi:MAG: hypothetical protein ABIO82_05135 [Ginsengibacter sp.]